MKVKDLTDYLSSIAPLEYQESYDNSGLIVGNPESTLKKALITLDVTEEVIEEAIREKCQLVIAHHPIIFTGLKRLSGSNYVERIVMKSIKKDIAIYAIHTNYDNIEDGVNAKICKRLGLQDCKILAPKKGLLKKLHTFIPVEDLDHVSAAVYNAGAGQIGNYSETSFSVRGTGTFKGNEHSNPAVGKKSVLTKASEMRFETIFSDHMEKAVIQALLESHPYEEVAYDIVSLDNPYNKVGSGMVGSLPKPVGELAFLKSLKKSLKTDSIRYTRLTGRSVERVAVCGGAGRFLLRDAIGAKADVFITADFKYHDFFEAEGKLVVADVGHYESEQFTKELMQEHILGKFPMFAAQISKVNTNPINYL